FQIYCDFSGYSDIGIGAAKTMGIDLMANFRSPYLSRSINEFWTRWHISLSTWFRDYVYIPLGGNRVTTPRWFANLFIVFLISGFWHGANWTFIAWGALHGFFLIAEICKNLLLKKAGYSFRPNFLKSIFQILITYLLVSFAWIFFRSAGMDEALYIIKKIMSFDLKEPVNLVLGKPELLFVTIMIVALLVKEYFFPILSTKNNALFAFAFIGLALCCYLFGVFNNKQFIYFQF
ncbi:MBOAT family O-acyltransferase, partial [Mucilaginibacter sp.]